MKGVDVSRVQISHSTPIYFTVFFIFFVLILIMVQTIDVQRVSCIMQNRSSPACSSFTLGTASYFYRSVIVRNTCTAKGESSMPILCGWNVRSRGRKRALCKWLLSPPDYRVYPCVQMIVSTCRALTIKQ